MKTYVTFGTDHEHTVGDQFYDADCIAVIEAENATEGREIAWKAFGPKFCTTYSEKNWSDEDMRFYPRGYIDVEVPLAED